MGYALQRRGLGSTVGDAVRRLETESYVVLCDNWAQIPQATRPAVHGMRRAMAEAKRALRVPSNRRDTCRIYLAKPAGSNRPPSGTAGMGQLLTDWACDSTVYARAWRGRMNEGLDAGAQAALIGGILAGVVGAATKSMAVGALAGAAAGWTAHAVWTAPHRNT